MSHALVVVSFMVYTLLLLILALWAERRPRLVRNRFVYALSFAVYITAWSFNGSVGEFINSGFLFLPPYFGILCSIFLLWIVLKKMVRLKNAYRITSLADFIATRYGKSLFMGALVTTVSLFCMVPYVALQLKAVITSFELMTGTSGRELGAIPGGIGTIFSLLMVLLVIVLGVRKIDPTERHPGIVFVIAVESVVKLAAILGLGFFVIYGLFSGFDDALGHITSLSDLKSRVSTHNEPGFYSRWFFYMLISTGPLLFMPRMFHISVVENADEKNILTAMWLMPIYTIAFVLFIIPIAVAGITLGLPPHLADVFVVAIPLATGHQWVALIAFLGGFSAAAAMVMVSAMTMAVMIGNYFVLPIAEALPRLAWLKRRLLLTRWLAVTLFVFLGFAFEYYIAARYSLVNLGIKAFVGAFQIVPAAIGGLYWRRGNRVGAATGISLGFLIWFYTLMLPDLERIGLPISVLKEGPFGFDWLHPEHLFGLKSLDSISHSVFWSAFFNLGSYVLGSILVRPNSFEQELADEFVNEGVSWKKAARQSKANIVLLPEKIEKLEGVLEQYMSEEDAARIVMTCVNKIKLCDRTMISVLELATLASEVERMLGGAIGSAIAYRAMKSAGIFTEPEAAALASEYAKQLFELRLTPQRMKERLDYYREREQLLLGHAQELEEAIHERDLEIVKRHETEEELREAMDKAIAADQAKTEFLGVVSHELRTPLNGILGGVEILEFDLQSPDAHQFLEMIRRNASRLTLVIDDILNISSVSAGPVKIEAIPFSVRDVVASALKNFEDVARSKRIALRSEVDMALPGILHGDAGRIRQILLNIIGNAVKFTEVGSVFVSVKRIAEAGSQLRIRFEVHDTGIGISPENQSRLFQPFTQAESFLTRRYGGTGLGLAVAKRLVEAMRGQIGVKSEVGKGSTFWFELDLTLP